MSQKVSVLISARACIHFIHTHPHHRSPVCSQIFPMTFNIGSLPRVGNPNRCKLKCTTLSGWPVYQAAVQGANIQQAYREEKNMVITGLFRRKLKW